MRRRACKKRYGHAKGADRRLRAERRKLLPYNDKVRNEQRFGAGVRQELKAMFFSGGPSGLAMPTGVRTSAAEGSAKAGNDAAACYREHISEFDELHRRGFTATDAARLIGNKYHVRHFR